MALEAHGRIDSYDEFNDKLVGNEDKNEPATKDGDDKEPVYDKGPKDDNSKDSGMFYDKVTGLW